MDYHVEVDGHYYSVPHALVRRQLDVRLTARTVECFHRGQARRQPRPLPGQGASHHRGRAHAREAPPEGRLDTRPLHRLGREDRTGHHRPDQGTDTIRAVIHANGSA